MQQSLHQRQAIDAVIRRQLRGLPSAPTRSGASAPATPPASEQEGAGLASSSPAPSDPLDHPLVQLAALFAGWSVMGLIVSACLLGPLG